MACMSDASNHNIYNPLLCSQQATARCRRDCSCEQKYKWHRLLAYDPNNDCAGVFMDWFLFPACCSCRSAAAVTCFLFIEHCIVIIQVSQ